MEITILPEFRGHGYGSEVLGYLLEPKRARTTGC